jgi:antitoxin ParD1/3/4
MDMNFSLTPSLEQFIRDRAGSGDYNNASEVVREAIRLLKRVEERRALNMERLRRAIGEGDEALALGEFTDLNSDEDLDAFFAEI